MICRSQLRSFPGQCFKLHIQSQIATCRRLQIVSIVLYFIALYCIGNVSYNMLYSPNCTLSNWHISALSCIHVNSTFYALPPPICNASTLRILSEIFAGNERDFLWKKMQRKLLSESDKYKGVFRGKKTGGGETILSSLRTGDSFGQNTRTVHKSSSSSQMTIARRLEISCE